MVSGRWACHGLSWLISTLGLAVGVWQTFGGIVAAADRREAERAFSEEVAADISIYLWVAVLSVFAGLLTLALRRVKVFQGALPAIQCPQCKSTSVRRSARRGIWDRLWAMAARYPFRCEQCTRRFRRFRLWRRA